MFVVLFQDAVSAASRVAEESTYSHEACVLCNSPVFTDEDPEVNVTKVNKDRNRYSRESISPLRVIENSILT